MRFYTLHILNRVCNWPVVTFSKRFSSCIGLIFCVALTHPNAIIHGNAMWQHRLLYSNFKSQKTVQVFFLSHFGAALFIKNSVSVTLFILVFGFFCVCALFHWELENISGQNRSMIMKREHIFKPNLNYAEWIKKNCLIRRYLENISIFKECFELNLVFFLEKKLSWNIRKHLE